MKIHLLGFLLAMALGNLARAQSTVTGKIVNEASGELLPFVNIGIRGTTSGTTSDVEGRFSLSWNGDSITLVFSFVGYESLTRPVSRTDKSIVVRLREKTATLDAIEVRPEDNPALIIIRKVIANKEKNDPENLPSFSYHAYNKLAMSLEGNSDSVKNKKEEAFQKFADRNHVFVSESFTERKYVAPDHSKETVLANKMSGIKDPFFALMATDFQPFSFYKDHIPLLNIKYVNPISPGSPDLYDFTIVDTVYHAPDSVFILSFEPLGGKAFQGLKGQLYISSDGFALEHVLAQTADEYALIDFHIQQKYQKVSGHWFPLQLNSEFRFREYQMAGRKPHYVQRSYLSDVVIGQKIEKKEFGLLNVEFDAEANHKDDAFWNSHRPDTLDRKERNTYSFYDSLGPKMNMLNTSMKVLEGVLVGKFSAGKFYIPIEYLAHFNQYEKIRLGFGLETGERISKIFSVDGYVGWGFQDQALKYGGGLKINLMPRHDGYIKFSYKQDITEPGGADFIRRPAGAINNESFRAWRAYRMDSVQQFKFELGIRTLRFSQVEFFFQRQDRNPTYAYSFRADGDLTGSRTHFTATEAGIKLRIAFREHYTQIGNSKVVSNEAYPQLNINLSHGFAGIWDGKYEFDKIQVQIDHQWLIRRVGTLTVQLDGGVISGKVPYPFLFNGKGSNIAGSFLNNFVAKNYFQTMGFYEFASDRFAYLFVNHNFGRLTGTSSKTFRPELAIMQGVGFGSLQNRSDHTGIAISTLEKGYYESGVLIDNLIRFKYLKLFYFGVGGGVFYRYGDYALPKQADNFAYKVMVSASF